MTTLEQRAAILRARLARELAGERMPPMLTPKRSKTLPELRAELAHAEEMFEAAQHGRVKDKSWFARECERLRGMVEEAADGATPSVPQTM